ncbi:MAG TPA: polyphosphate kinase 1, partial [Phnomibacter sp.]|nr:polyphosphate kinase 1 [Phnomibacter sp.]
MAEKLFADRDKSWLAFNRRVLEEAASEHVPLLERIKFLSIFSSNLDEFYRVRMPALLALEKIRKKKGGVYDQLNSLIFQQQKRFGYILDEVIVPLMKKEKVHFINAEQIPRALLPPVREIFFNEVAGLLQPVLLGPQSQFFPENNQLYTLVVYKKGKRDEGLGVVNIPTRDLPRFFTIPHGKYKYIVFLDDIIRCHLQDIFIGQKIISSFNIKVTRDAELNLTDDFEEDIALKIEKKLQRRDFGLATRFLYEPGIPLRHMKRLMDLFDLHISCAVSGGVHHAYKDLFNFPYKDPALQYPEWPALDLKIGSDTLFEQISTGDLMVHTPYLSYNTVLRFFNEAAIDPRVDVVYTTLYRIASDSRIAQALIQAARNGKKVIVLVELKARFDEANNLRWSKRMKEAGVKIIYSSANIKVHAKIALVIRKHETHPYLGLLATGNLNENTAKVYTDHILLTAHQPLLKELNTLFEFLQTKQQPDETDKIGFRHLLVAQFNLHDRFLKLIEREIAHAKAGKPAGIIIKLNNLEEEKLIRKLYKASKAGVKVQMMVRSICCLRPGVKDLSEHITIKRIVDRYLEHGRVFIFENCGVPEVYVGSSDWMIRNIYRRIEVCFPIYDAAIKKELMDIIQ